MGIGMRGVNRKMGQNAERLHFTMYPMFYDTPMFTVFYAQQPRQSQNRETDVFPRIYKTLTDLSMEPVIMYEQSQLNCAELISPLWPISVCSFCPVSTCQIMTV